MWICRYVPDHRYGSSLPTYVLEIWKRAQTGITVGFRPHDNRRLIVHECSAFGPEEVQAVRDFITSRQASETLHAIW